jgi:hypothetical protein
MNHFVRMESVEVERYGNDLGLISLLKDPWPITAVERQPVTK